MMIDNYEINDQLAYKACEAFVETLAAFNPRVEASRDQILRIRKQELSFDYNVIGIILDQGLLVVGKRLLDEMSIQRIEISAANDTAK